MNPHDLSPTSRNKGGRPRNGNTPSNASRGYGIEHVKQRAWWAPQVATGTIRCALCGQLIPPRTRWHLAHADRADAHRRGLYAGPAHARCNNGTNRRRLRTEREREPQARPKALEFFDTNKQQTPECN